MKPISHSQAGYGLVSALLGVLVTISAVVFTYAALDTRAFANDLSRNQHEYLVELKHQVERWYEANASTLDTSSTPLDLTDFWQTAPMRPWNVTVSSSVRLNKGDGVAYHIIAIWLPDAGGDSTTFDQATGQLSVQKGTPYVLVDGAAIEGRLLQETLVKLGTIAHYLEGHFQAMAQHGADQASNINYFRAADCTTPTTQELPCIDSDTPLAETTLPARFTWPSQANYDAWGNPIRVSNRQDATSSSPFSMAVKTISPWGGMLQVVASQSNTAF